MIFVTLVRINKEPKYCVQCEIKESEVLKTQQRFQDLVDTRFKDKGISLDFSQIVVPDKNTVKDASDQLLAFFTKTFCEG